MKWLVLLLISMAACSEVATMKLTSSAFKQNKNIPSQYTCDGENKSPPLEISDVPKNAESLALIMEDPDAVKPAGKVWDHWLIWNLPATTKKIPEGTEPVGVHGKTTSNTLAYTGPCPPDMEHRYFFKLYALDTVLDLPVGSSKKQLLEAMKWHVVAEAELIGKYERSK